MNFEPRAQIKRGRRGGCGKRYAGSLLKVDVPILCCPMNQVKSFASNSQYENFLT
jgi:hypothetical protein